MIGEQKTGAIEGVVITAVSHEGLTVTVDGKPARLAVVADNDEIIAIGKQVAREAAAVAVNNYRGFLRGQGFLRVFSNPLEKFQSQKPPP